MSRVKCIARIKKNDQYLQCSRNKSEGQEFCRTHFKKFNNKTLKFGKMTDNLDDILKKITPDKKRNVIINDNLSNHNINRGSKPYYVVEKKIQGRRLYLAIKEQLYFEHPDDDDNDVIIVGANINGKFAKKIKYQDKTYYVNDKNIVYSTKYNTVGIYCDGKVKLKKQ